MIQITEAHRTGARTVWGFAGQSGAGKTYSAIQFGYGLAGYDSSKLGVLDTENGRGALYSDTLTDDAGKIQRFKIARFDPPHSPARYIEAIDAFQRAGVEVLVIDSVSHEWEGIGGCHDIAESDRKRWAAAKSAHRRFMAALLSCDMHIIACIRARPKVKITGRGRDQVFEELGVMPVAEKNFVFELTGGIMFSDAGRSRTVLKQPPADVRPHLCHAREYITAADGYAVRQWIEGADPVDPEVESYRNRLRMITERGAAYVRDAWENKTPQRIRQALGEDFAASIMAAAEAYDQQGEPLDDDADDPSALLGGA